jgi:putative tryptophan/tyrosine transport system substrate-binding protein
MHRRDFVRLGLLGSTAVSIPAAARAQQPKPPVRIGVLLPVPGNDHFLASLLEGFRDIGWKDDRDFILEVRRADGTVPAFRGLGRELVVLPVDVLVTASTAAATALAQLTTTIPIVFVGAYDPVAAGLVASLDHPGRNLTGIAGFQADIAARWVSLLKEIAPSVTRMVIFSNPASISPAALAGWKAVASRSADIDEAHVDSIEDIERAAADVSQDARAGMIVVPHTFPFANRKIVVDAMAKHRVPAIYGIAEMVRSGGLVSYGQDLGAQWRMAAGYIDKIAGGTNPADLAVQYATKYALAINRGAATSLGLTIPKDMIERADEVIQ